MSQPTKRRITAHVVVQQSHLSHDRLPTSTDTTHARSTLQADRQRYLMRTLVNQRAHQVI
jgi:hypothetical protein